MSKNAPKQNAPKQNAPKQGEALRLLCPAAWLCALLFAAAGTAARPSKQTSAAKSGTAAGTAARPSKQTSRGNGREAGPTNKPSKQTSRGNGREAGPTNKPAQQTSAAKSGTAAGTAAHPSQQTSAPAAAAGQPLPKNAKTVLKNFLKLFLDSKSRDAERYSQAVEILEASVYSKASFETLKLLAETYRENKDYLNQIKVLSHTAQAYSNMPEPYYLLGKAYKAIYLQDKTKTGRRDLAVDNLSQAIRKNRKDAAAYEEVLPLIKEQGHTKHSLALVIDMIRYIKKPEYYSELCMAYFETGFFQQSRRACKKSIAQNPKDPASHILLALSQIKPNKRKSMVIEAAGRFKKSFYVQKQAWLFFLKEKNSMAFTYLKAAASLNPEELELQKLLARRFFKDKKYSLAHKHFARACVLSHGRFLKEFRRAANKLSRLKLPAAKKKSLTAKFNKGVEICFAQRKKEIQQAAAEPKKKDGLKLPSD